MAKKVIDPVDVAKTEKVLESLIASVTSDGAKLTTMIKSLMHSINNVNQRKALIAAGSVVHAIEHNQVTPLRDLYEALGDTDRRDTFVKWAVNCAPVKWVKDEDTKRLTFKFDNTRSEQLRTAIANDRNGYVREMLVKPYWVFLPARELAPFDFNTALNALLKRAKSAQENGTFKGDVAKVEQLARLVA